MPTLEVLRQRVENTRQWVASLDLDAIASPDRGDTTDLKEIGVALTATVVSALELAEAVQRARANGRTWTQIAVILAVSKQAARERFGEQ